MRHAVLPVLLVLCTTVAFAADIPPVPAPPGFPASQGVPRRQGLPRHRLRRDPHGKTLNTAAIQKAIDACSAAGGGTVVIPRTDRGSVYMSGAIFLKKGTNLRIEKEAVLKGLARPGPIPDHRHPLRRHRAAFHVRLPQRHQPRRHHRLRRGHDRRFRRPVAQRHHQGSRAGRRLRRPDPAGQHARARPRPRSNGAHAAASNPLHRPADRSHAHAGQPAAAGDRTAGPNRPRLALFSNCTNTAIKDLHLQNQAVWCLHILYCTDFLVDNLTILDPTHTVPSSDGIDIDSSRRVRVNKTTISVNDDCISIKSGKDADGRRVNRACEDILIVNSHMAEGQGGAAMGSEVSGTIRNVEVRDMLVDSGNWAPIRFKSQDTRGGTVENIVYRNLKIAGVRQVFDFNLNLGRHQPSGFCMPTTVKNIYIINVSGSASGGGAIVGLPDSPNHQHLVPRLQSHLRHPGASHQHRQSRHRRPENHLAQRRSGINHRQFDRRHEGRPKKSGTQTQP